MRKQSISTFQQDGLVLLCYLHPVQARHYEAIFIGGGAAGFFAALAYAHAGGRHALILEKGPQFLQKVRISGGGRCNVTHSLFDAREFSKRYPRGSRELIGLLNRFSARDTVEWFESRGVKLKAEADGRMFPVTDSSQTIIDCLLREARAANIELRANTSVEALEKTAHGFRLRLSSSAEPITAQKILLATGGARVPAMADLATKLGHSLVDPVPSLFTLQISIPWLRELSGVSLELAELTVPDTTLRERGPLLITHWGLSGPVTLRLSAWGARELAKLNYNFQLRVNWLPHLTEDAVRAELQKRIQTQPAKLLVNAPIAPLTARLWEALVTHAAALPRDLRWSNLSRAQLHTLTQTLHRLELPVTGKSLNKDEFVTCGGIKLTEIDFKTMQSRLLPNLHFAGELLDLDGITGGFNFQAAWSTGHVAGKAMASVPSEG